MDLRTIMLMLAIGSFLFGILLMVFNKNNTQKVPFWIAAKFLQTAGTLMLYYRMRMFDIFTILTNIALLLGCAYEAWAIRVLLGQAVKRMIHISTSVGIILICLLTVFLIEDALMLLWNMSIPGLNGQTLNCRSFCLMLTISKIIMIIMDMSWEMNVCVKSVRY